MLAGDVNRGAFADGAFSGNVVEQAHVGIFRHDQTVRPTTIPGTILLRLASVERKEARLLARDRKISGCLLEVVVDRARARLRRANEQKIRQCHPTNVLDPLGMRKSAAYTLASLSFPVRDRFSGWVRRILVLRKIRLLLVFGLSRSGTTFLAEALTLGNDEAVKLHEPVKKLLRLSYQGAGADRQTTRRFGVGYSNPSEFRGRCICWSAPLQWRLFVHRTGFSASSDFHVRLC